MEQFTEAFLDTANEAIIEEMESFLSEESFRTSEVVIYNDVHEMRLRRFINDGDRIIALSRKPIELGVSEHNTFGFCELKTAGLAVLLNRGQLTEARMVARQVLEIDEIVRSQLLGDEPDVKGVMAFAHVALGNVEEARLLADDLLESRDESHRALVILSRVDTERAVEFAFAELASNPNWDGFDSLAAFQVLSRPFLAHPKVQEYYVKQGKWIDYLAARVPAYGKYKDRAQ